MSSKWLVLALGMGLSWFPQMAAAQWSASEKGTLLGAVAGGGAGAAIGKKNGNPIVGAVVGGLGGAIVGNVIGDGVDQRRAEAAYQQQLQQQYAYRQPGVSLDQVIQLTRSGVGDDLIVSHIQQNGYHQALTANDLILLKNQGVSDRVIFALQRPAAPAPVYAPPVRYAPPVTVVEEVHVVPAWHGPAYYYPRPMPVYGYPHYHRYHSSSSHFNFRF